MNHDLLQHPSFKLPGLKWLRLVTTPYYPFPRHALFSRQQCSPIGALWTSAKWTFNYLTLGQSSFRQSNRDRWWQVTSWFCYNMHGSHTRLQSCRLHFKRTSRPGGQTTGVRRGDMLSGLWRVTTHRSGNGPLRRFLCAIRHPNNQRCLHTIWRIIDKPSAEQL
jgi:hypothetical protein